MDEGRVLFETAIIVAGREILLASSASLSLALPASPNWKTSRAESASQRTNTINRRRTRRLGWGYALIACLQLRRLAKQSASPISIEYFLVPRWRLMDAVADIAIHPDRLMPTPGKPISSRLP
jgi:hypothetical protein